MLLGLPPQRYRFVLLKLRFAFWLSVLHGNDLVRCKCALDIQLYVGVVRRDAQGYELRRESDVSRFVRDRNFVGREVQLVTAFLVGNQLFLTHGNFKFSVAVGLGKHNRAGGRSACAVNLDYLVGLDAFGPIFLQVKWLGIVGHNLAEASLNLAEANIHFLNSLDCLNHHWLVLFVDGVLEDASQRVIEFSYTCC